MPRTNKNEVVDQVDEEELSYDEDEGVSFETMTGAKITDTPAPPPPVVVDETDEVLGYENDSPQYQFENPTIDAEDMAMPRIRLTQLTTPEVADQLVPPGVWLVKDYDPVEQVIVIPQAVVKTRELRNDDGQLIARSPNGIRCCENPKQRCAMCPKAQWDRSNPEAPRPPQCQEVWRYIVTSVSHDILAEMVFQKTAVPAAKFINLQIKLKGLGNFALQIGASKEKGKARNSPSYFVPRPTIAQIEPGELAKAREAAVPKITPQLATQTG